MGYKGLDLAVLRVIANELYVMRRDREEEKSKKLVSLWNHGGRERVVHEIENLRDVLKLSGRD